MFGSNISKIERISLINKQLRLKERGNINLSLIQKIDFENTKNRQKEGKAFLKLREKIIMLVLAYIIHF